MGIKITDAVSWVGKIDWEIRTFHGEEYSTHRGSTFNSYLVRDEKTALIDTVWYPFAEEFVENLTKEIDLNTIDYIVANHSEPDHSGSLPALLEAIPDTPVYCTAPGAKFLKALFHKGWNFQVVKTGDKITLGTKELMFIEAPMLHWPDNMFTYLTGDNILFSNDAFGHHFASEFMFNDLVDQAELYQECIKYYANILTPFSMLVDKKIKEVTELNVPVDMICPSHGVIWRSDPMQIVKKYSEWANDFQENQITIIYDTMWNGTRRMAEAITKGISHEDGSVVVKLFNIAKSDKNDVITEVFKSKAVLVGSPTINRGILSAVAAILEEIRGLSFKNKKAAAFGCYGWSGESVKMISEKLKDGGFELLNEGLREKWDPSSQAVQNCFDFGKAAAAALK